MPRSYLLLLFLYCFLVEESIEDDNDFVTKRINHRPLTIEPQKLALISNLSNKVHLKNAVEKILVPRIVGTEGHTQVQEYIKNSMISLNWHVDNDTFEDQTPNFGLLKFENIIATVNPDAERFLVLACHYDSKYIPDVEFLGATDSAVPCAMLINLAHTLKDHLTKIATKNDLSLMFIFFDGEEAFQEWGPTDSIYGARHLAKKWKDENFLSRLDMLMLIDLIGMPDPKFYSFFRNTETWYAQLLHSEERLATDGHLENYTTSSAVSPVESNRYFQPRSANSYIEDDHIPFLNLGVPIMHLIPVPFPEVWHKDTDNHEIVDYTTVENINKILRIFVIEYLNIEIE